MARGAPDWYNAVSIFGDYNNDVKRVAVDADGNIQAFLKALYDSTVTNVKCDANGNIFMNVKAQDLAEVINRPTYGGPLVANASTTNPTTGSHSLVSITGTGWGYGGFLYMNGDADFKDDYFTYIIDGEVMGGLTPDQFMDYGFYHSNPTSFHLTHYSEINDIYVQELYGGISFESSLAVSFIAGGNRTGTVGAFILYALI